MTITFEVGDSNVKVFNARANITEKWLNLSSRTSKEFLLSVLILTYSINECLPIPVSGTSRDHIAPKPLSSSIAKTNSCRPSFRTKKKFEHVIYNQRNHHNPSLREVISSLY